MRFCKTPISREEVLVSDMNTPCKNPLSPTGNIICGSAPKKNHTPHPQAATTRKVRKFWRSIHLSVGE